jgi:hypothetical protein
MQKNLRRVSFPKILIFSYLIRSWLLPEHFPATGGIQVNNLYSTQSTEISGEIMHFNIFLVQCGTGIILEIFMVKKIIISDKIVTGI